MKNFTMNFLREGRSTVRFLRKIGLSLIVLLWTVSVFAQENQDTYHVYAESADYCYHQDNLYEVQIKMKDFVKFYDFDLSLNFNGTLFTFKGVKDVVSELTGMTTVTSGNVINMKWTTPNAGAPAGERWSTIEETDDAEGGYPVYTLVFELKGTPFHYSYYNTFSFTNNLTWGNSFYHNLPGQHDIITFEKTNGTMTVTELWQDIVVTQTTPDCTGGLITLSVVDPAGAGLEYSWNGNTFQSTPYTDVQATSISHTVRVRNADGCISYIKTVEVEQNEVVSFDYIVEDAECPGGAADLEIIVKNGNAPFIYYAVPENLWAPILTSGNLTELNRYAGSHHVRQLDTQPTGERFYYIAVQDARGCVNLLDESSWKKVRAYDPNTPFTPVENITASSCAGNNGRVQVTMTGATPFPDGTYNTFFNGSWVARANNINRGSLAAGEYYVRFEDANGCIWEKTYTIARPIPITFDLEWKDTGCQQAQGELWVVPNSITGGTVIVPDYSDWYWEYSKDPNFNIDVERIDGAYTVATGIEAGVYYMQLYDAAGCKQQWNNVENDQAIKIMDVDFEVEYTSLCYGAEFVPVTIKLITGSGNHDFEYSKDGGQTWQAENYFEIPISDFTNNEATVGFAVIDHYANECVYDLITTIYQNPKMEAKIIPYLTLPPTCPESADGNLAFYVTGGTPFANGGYEYKVCDGHLFDGESDQCNAQWHKSNSAQFSINVGIDNRMHTYFFRDATGCETRVMFNFPNFKNKIAFRDVIQLGCRGDRVNLLHARPSSQNCQNTLFGICWDDFDLSSTYLDLYDATQEKWEDRLLWQWHGIPLGHVIKSIDWSDWQSYLPIVADYFTSWGITDTDILVQKIMEWSSTSVSFQEVKDFLTNEFGMDIYGVGDLTVDNVQKVIDFLSSFNFEYKYWTSDEGYKYVVTQGIQPLRSPYIYYSSEATTPNAIYEEGNVLRHDTSFGAGKYYLVARDEFGCFSNVEMIEVKNPPEFKIEVTTEDATCFNALDGKIIVKAINGSSELIPGTPWTNPTLQYAIIDNPAILNALNWHLHLTWLPMDANPFEKIFKAGTYWVIVRDYCGLIHPENILVEEVTIGGGVELIIDPGKMEITGVTCSVLGQPNSNDGKVVITEGSVSGGDGTYTCSMTDNATGKKYNPVNGTFSNLPGGVYTFTVVDGKGCTAVKEITILATDFYAETFVANPSCYDLHDGFIRYHIYGGTAPYWETTNNIGEFEDPALVPAERWYKIDSDTYVNYGTHKAFDRRVRAGEYEIYVKDAKGCIYGPIYELVEQPAPLGFTYTTESACTANGTEARIILNLEGGWNRLADDYWYSVELYQGATKLQTKYYDVTNDIHDPVYFDVTETGTYTVKIYERKAGLWFSALALPNSDGNQPIINNFDYFDRFEEYRDQLPWQNNSNCAYTGTVVVNPPVGITYDREFKNASCNLGDDGVIRIWNVQGGKANYWFGLEGPDGSGYEVLFDAVNGDNWYPKNTTGGVSATGALSYTFNNLVHGHYNIYIMDANGCIVFKESTEINKPGLLNLQLVKIKDASSCGMGEFEMIGTGGSEESVFEYATLPVDYNFSTDFDVENLAWQDSPIFEVPAGTWIGYMRDKNNPICWVGGPTLGDGTVIQRHRVTILGVPQVTANITATASPCYAQPNGIINVSGLTGGNGAPYSALVTGTRYDGEPVEKTYTNVGSTLTGLYASYGNYTVIFYDKDGCPSAAKTVSVGQPDAFIISLEATQDAFICHNDLSGIFEIKVLSGGTPFGYTNGDPTKPIYQYYWEAYNADGVLVPHLTGTWGFTNTFLGYANYTYKVTARDAKGCETSVERFINAPDPIAIDDIKDISCYGDANASARITVLGTEGREFTIQYRKYANDVPISGWMGDAVTVGGVHVYTSLTYGDDLGGEDGHYEFRAYENINCISDTKRHTFVPVQHELTAVIENVVDTECGGDVTIKVFGGTAPYMVTIDGVTQQVGNSNESTTIVAVMGGAWDVVVVDDHECVFSELKVDIAGTGGDLLVYDTFFVPVGESAQYVNDDYDIDEEVDAAGSPYIFNVTLTNGCAGILELTVFEKGQTVMIADIQGTGGPSPMLGDIVDVVGTVMGIVPGVGYYIQDAIAAWSGILVLDPVTDVAIGDGVRISMGEVIEVDGVTCLDGVGVVIATATKSTGDYTPLEVVPIIVTPTEAKDQKYASVLVKIEGARADELIAGEWDIYYEDDDRITVGDLMYAYTPKEGDFYHVTGIVNGAGGVYTLEPRFEADIVNITETTPVTPVIPNVVEFKLYPNPVDNVNDKLYIDNYDKLTRITVTNIAGQRILDINNPVENYIRTANLVKGVYVVTLFTEKGIAKSERIVKR